MLASEDKSDEKLARISELGSKSDSGFERAAFLATAADIALDTGDLKKVNAAIETIPGDTLGAWLRLRAYLRAAKSLGGEVSEGLLESAKREAQGVKQPLLRKHLEGLLE